MGRMKLVRVNPHKAPRWREPRTAEILKDRADSQANTLLTAIKIHQHKHRMQLADEARLIREARLLLGWREKEQKYD